MNANNLPEAKLLRKKLKNGLIVDKWDLVTIIENQQAEITRLKLEWQYMADLTEKLQDFAIWMTGCGYDFCQHEYFIKCRDELLKGVRNERK